MRARIAKWGNSLALRIPKAFAASARLQPGTVVEVDLDDGRVVLTPMREVFTLEDLLARVTPENIHESTDTGDPAGREHW